VDTHVGSEPGNRSPRHPYWAATIGVAGLIGGYVLALWALSGSRPCGDPHVTSGAWLLVILLVALFGMLLLPARWLVVGRIAVVGLTIGVVIGLLLVQRCVQPG
jgi:hypothetical protein